MSKMFLYRADFPFSNRILNFKELSTRNQLDIEKINLYYPQSPDFYLDYHENFTKIIKDCVENKEDFEKLDIIEYILFCLKLRIVSVGNLIEFNIKSDREDVDNVKIKVDLKEIMQNLLNISINSLENSYIYDEKRDMLITIGYPQLSNVKFFYDNMISDKEIGEKVLSSLPLFIKNIKIKNEVINFEEYSYEQKLKAYESFPVSLKDKTEKIIIDCITKLGSDNILNIDIFKDQKINFYNLFFVDLLRVFFTQNAKSIYEEIYILSNFHVNSNYVMDISPSERKVYISFIKSQQKSKQDNGDIIENDMFERKNSKSVDDLAVEFGDIPPNY
jgi:hypothetical protein